jgi:hypothetical protein
VIEDGTLPTLRFRYYATTAAGYTSGNKWAARMPPTTRNSMGFAVSNEADFQYSTLVQMNFRSPAEHLL